MRGSQEGEQSRESRGEGADDIWGLRLNSVSERSKLGSEYFLISIGRDDQILYKILFYWRDYLIIVILRKEKYSLEFYGWHFNLEKTKTRPFTTRGIQLTLKFLNKIYEKISISPLPIVHNI